MINNSTRKREISCDFLDDTENNPREIAETGKKLDLLRAEAATSIHYRGNCASAAGMAMVLRGSTGVHLAKMDESGRMDDDPFCEITRRPSCEIGD
jgi:hypothetical protein